MTNKVNVTAENMPPTIGATMRPITSDPVPLPNRMGNRPDMVVAAVITTGRKRMLAPSLTTFLRSDVVKTRFSSSISRINHLLL